MAEAGKRTLHTGGDKIVSKNAIGGEFKIQKAPEYLKERIALFEELYKQQQEILAKANKRPIKIVLKDGKEIEGISFETTPYKIASTISKKLAENTLVAKVVYLNKDKSPFEATLAEYDPDEEQGEKKKLSKEFELLDMHRALEGDCKLELLTFADPEGKMAFWHSSAHILGESLELEYGCQLCIGPPLENGFYYDSYIGEEKITPADFGKIEKCAKQCVIENQQFQRLVVSKAKALELFKNNPFKMQLIQNKIPENGLTTVYRCGLLIDLCTGPHLPSSGKIKAFKIQKVSGAYWLGNKECDSLQRVYGIAFPSQKELDEYLKMQEFLLKNDHRNVGKQFDLFRFDDLGPGSCFFFPHGAKIYNKLIEIIRGEYRVRGYQEVVSPNMYDIKLWEISGHLAKYKDNLFLIKLDENVDQTLGLKPMNCPGHCVMFNMQARSYRDLPFRMADFGVLHRKELSGALSGLTRVYRFQQDDAHIFCRTDQIMEEVLACLDFVFYMYNMFGFEYKLALSTRPVNRLGDDELWDKAELALEEALKKCGKPYEINKGDGAFYGPKIDIQLFDVFKRAHQLGTVQCDFNMPIRFNLQYKTEEKTQEEDVEEKKIRDEEKKKLQEEQKEQKGKKGQKKEKKTEEVKEEIKVEQEEKKLEPMGKLKPGYARPVMVHRAILGSIERMMAILCEQTGGKWPFFISPRQIMICPISDKFVPYGLQVYNRLLLEGYAVEIDLSASTLNKKVRNAWLIQFNYIACVGGEEEANGTVDLKDRDKNERIGKFTMLELLKFFKTLQPKPSMYYNKCHDCALCDSREEDKINEELKLKMFFEGMKPGAKDDEWFEKYKDKAINSEIYPNIERWRNYMKFAKEQK